MNFGRFLLLVCLALASAPSLAGEAGAALLTVYSNTCSGTFRAELACQDLDSAQIWEPTLTNTPPLAPGDALRIATDALNVAGQIPRSFSAERIEICRCAGSHPGWVYVVGFTAFEACQPGSAPSFVNASVIVLMDGTALLPELAMGEGDVECEGASPVPGQTIPTMSQGEAPGASSPSDDLP